MRALRWSRYAASSLAVHGFLLILFQSVPEEAARPLVTTTEFHPVELPPPKPPAEPPKPPETPPQEEPVAKLPVPEKPAPRKDTPKEAAPAAPAAPVRLAGLGLSNAGLVFAAAESSARGPATPAREAVAAAPAPKPSVPEPPPLVRLADLSVRPAPPSLEGRLRANYPRELERQGIEGDALLRLTLSTEGKVITAQALSQSHAAFADACRRTLVGSVWSPPRDRGGRAVRTVVDYRCRFRVR